MFALFVSGQLAGEFTNFSQVANCFRQLTGSPPTYRERIMLLNGRTVTANGQHFQLIAEDAAVSMAAA